MKGGSLLKKIIYSSGFQACIPALVIMLLIHPLGSEYNLVIESPGKNSGQIAYSDLNSDSVSQTVYSGKGLPYFFITVKDPDSRLYDQWNLLDSLNPQISRIYFGDYNHNLKKEIYVFTHKDDSLFLNVNELLEPRGTKIERFFITKIGFINGEVTSLLSLIGFYDQNGDGNDELYFEISTGFRPDPRRIYFFDIANKKLNSSQFTGIICLSPEMKDIDGDKRPEIFGMVSACGNFGRKVPLSDSSSWFMVFNDSLKFEFSPVEFPGYVNYLETEGYRSDTFKGFLLSHVPMGVDTTVMSARLMQYSTKGKLIRYRLYSDFGLSGFIRLFVLKNDNSDKIYLLSDKFLELDDKLGFVRTVDPHFNSPFETYLFDIDNDGETEFLMYSATEERLLVFDSDLHRLAEINKKFSDGPWQLSEYFSKNHERKLYISAGNTGYILMLKNNPYHYFAFLAYPGVYLIILMFIIVIKRINTLQVVQKEGLKRRLVTLQLQGIKSQLDPHFTFNTLNSISSLIYLEDRLLAYDYMNKFTQLLRGLINDAERVYRSLGEELEFVTTYLDLEKLRFGDKFTYEIKIGEDINIREQVPKLVLHTFAENAIKHGIMSRAEGGNLKIGAIKIKDYLVLSVEDNGIGRTRSVGQSTSTGKGLKLTGEFYDILNQINKKPIKHTIIDLHDENGESTGTRVEISVPLTYL